MARSDVDEILLDTVPNNSKEVYSKKWEEFMIFIIVFIRLVFVFEK